MNAATSRERAHSFRLWEPVFWPATISYLLAVVGFAWRTTHLSQLLAAVGIASALIHASFAYGWKNALALASICVSIAFAMENIGIATGFPFGNYNFEVGRDLPHIGAVPVIVGPLWFGMGYFSWVVAAVLLDGADARLGERFNALALPVVAAFVMTQWDFVMDPPNATIAKAWIWRDGGAHFGVPLSNYLGWLLTSWMIYQAFAIYLAAHNRSRPTLQSLRFRLVAILFYLSAGLCHITPWLLGETGNVADGGGQTWRMIDIREAAVAAMMLTMFFTSMLAIVNLMRKRVERKA